MKHYFTADEHYSHANIIFYANRPFKTVEEMNEIIIKRHNERVKSDDHSYHVGDFSFRNSLGGKKGEGLPIKPYEYYKRLNGHLIFIKGSHDSNNALKTKNHRIVLKLGGIYINVVHDPKDIVIEDEKHYYPLHITAHVHNHWVTKEIKNKNNKPSLLYNCGVDVNNFYPVSFDEIKRVWDNWLKNHKQKQEILSWIKQYQLK